IASASGFSTIVIDAGHGGHDRGGIPGQRACEKELTLDVARRLRGILNENGLKTVMTRSDDTFIPLPQRAAIANANPDALFVSIHFNSAIRSGANGFETFYYNPKAAAVAARIQAGLMRVEPVENRGIKRRAFYVLRKTRIPAVLAECGFLTNRAEAALCQQPAHRQNLASAIAKAIEASR
ncbi:MAG: N-acetylmuramoyl-L-alanine amidase, partial [Verrucomicrobia bacterium]|nr:N-acetylmuramoyl-L-alanine amidase [Verrucomicrobiota bacterium]